MARLPVTRQAALSKAPSVLAPVRRSASLGRQNGRAKARKLSCDFGHDYVSVNADYRT